MREREVREEMRGFIGFVPQKALAYTTVYLVG
jgi:hypothetical protein